MVLRLYYGWVQLNGCPGFVDVIRLLKIPANGFCSPLGYLIITLSAQLGIVAFIDLLDIAFFSPKPITYLKQACVGLGWILIVGVTYEVLYYLKMYREAIMEAEAVQKESLQRQYDHLKNQINPHFLFNSLNSLSALIDENPKLANEFLDELSSVYRYLLQNHDHRLTTLKAEVNFLKSYYYLLKSRFGDGIDLSLAIDDAQLNALIPPLSLQLLIENAITYNTIELGQPLKIVICNTADGHLLVSNNNQPKPQPMAMATDRLATIKARFRQIQLPEPRVTDHEKVTTIWIPLLGKMSAQSYLYGKDGFVSGTKQPLQP